MKQCFTAFRRATLAPQMGAAYDGGMAVILDKRQQDELVRLLQDGVLKSTALQVMGLTFDDLLNTYLAQPMFRLRAEGAYARAQAKLEVVRYKAALDDPKLAGEVLATRDPFQHSQRVQAALAMEAARSADAHNRGLPPEMVRAAQDAIAGVRERLAAVDAELAEDAPDRT